MIRMEQPVPLPLGWRFGIIIREGDMTVHAWLLYGDIVDTNRTALLEEFVHAGSMPELVAAALRKIATAAGEAHI